MNAPHTPGPENIERWGVMLDYLRGTTITLLGLRTVLFLATWVGWMKVRRLSFALFCSLLLLYGLCCSGCSFATAPGTLRGAARGAALGCALIRNRSSPPLLRKSTSLLYYPATACAAAGATDLRPHARVVV